MPDNQLLYLSRQDVIATGISMATVIGALDQAFTEKGAGHVEMPPKPGIHPGAGDNFIHAMPAYIPAMQSAGIKWVSGFPGNNDKGLPYISGLLILNDVETGFPLSVMDCTWITAVRTGAASALSAKHLARPQSSTVGVLGCGIQGRSNVEALNVLFPLKHVVAYDVNKDTARSYAAHIEDQYELNVTIAGSPEEAVRGMDIVVTAGPILKRPHATIQPGWLDQGGFATLVDFDSYWHPDALRQADKFCTDDTAQYQHYQEVGYFQNCPPIHADLGELVTAQKPGRESDSERILAANLGLAMDDMAVAPLIYKAAVENNLGTWLPL